MLLKSLAITAHILVTVCTMRTMCFGVDKWDSDVK